MLTTIETITPDHARQLLATNSKNRRLNPYHVAFFEDQIKSGGWKLTHQGIALGTGGELLDGQHRLTAIANTGIPVDVLVSRGLSPDSFDVFDTGRVRNGSDVLSIGGAKGYCALAAAIRLRLFHRIAPDKEWNNHRVTRPIATNRAIREEYESDPEGWDWASRLARSYVTSKILVPGPFSCFLHLAKAVGHSSFDLERFAAKLRTGDALELGHPILAYRSRAVNTLKLVLPQARLADYIRLYNAVYWSETLKTFKPTSFPPVPAITPVCEGVSPNL